MEKIRKIIQNYQSRMIWFCANFGMLLVFWGGMLRKSFNADTVFHMVVDDADVRCNMRAGRYVIGLIDGLLFKLGLRTTTNLSVTMLLAFVIFAVALCKLQGIFREWCPKDTFLKAGFLCGVSLVFFNVLFAEPLMFSEYCVYYAIGYFAAIMAADCYLRRRYAGMFLALLVAVSSYQYTVIFAAILLAFVICLEEKQELSMRKVLREMTAVGSCVGVGVLNLLSMVLLEKIGVFADLEKNAGLGSLKDKLQDMVKSFIDLNQSSAGIMPDIWIPLLFSLSVWVLIILSCIKEKKINMLVFIAIVWLGSHILLYIIPFANETFYFPPRMSFCFFFIQGLLVAAAYVVSEEKVQKLLTWGCLTYFLIQLLFADFTVTNHFVSNTLDETYTNMVYQEILQYEETTGIQVKKLAVGNDAYAPNHYNNVSYTSEQINERVVGQVTSSLMTVISGRYFEPAEIDEEIYKRYFEGKDWDYFDLSQQLIIEGDTAYWCVF